MQRSITITAIITAAAIAMTGLAVLVYMPAERQDGAEGQVRLLAASLGDRMDNSIRVMRLTAMQPEVRNTDTLSQISEKQMGIPRDSDPDKRQAAQNVLGQYGDFASIFFLTPEGDIYIGEPYEQQEQLPRLNYSDRDWYQGVSATRDAYVSSVFMSAAIHVPAVAVAVPVYSVEDAQEVGGYWVAIINLGSIEDSLAGLGDSRIIFADHNGVEIADSARNPSEERTELRSFAGLESVKQALAGNSGSLVETIDGMTMTVHYAPVGAYPHTWAVISAEPAP